MRHFALDKLLILQDRDGKRLGLEAQLKAWPGEVATVEQKIAGERAAIDAAKAEMRELEMKKKSLETDLGSVETKLAKYKTQQAAVRKNEEFRALGHEIETTQAEIGVFEEKELEVMYAIDEAKKRFAGAEGEIKKSIANLETKLAALRERETNLRAELKGAIEVAMAARSEVDAVALKTYDRLAPRTWPVCVALRGAKCSGCHLKVSSEVESNARTGENLVTCDQCGRIVWWEM